MRVVLIAVLMLAACSGAAQSENRYDVYIFQPREGGPQTYAFAAADRAVALEVRGCGDVRLLPDAATVTADLSARRAAPETSVVTVQGRGSRTEFGSCSADDFAADEDGEDDLIVIESVNARQMRAMIRTLDAAPNDVRERMIDTLGLS